jgi:hypothetical protein
MIYLEHKQDTCQWKAVAPLYRSISESAPGAWPQQQVTDMRRPSGVTWRRQEAAVSGRGEVSAPVP